MLHALKEELFDLLPREAVPPAMTLEEPPVAEEFCTCPECGYPGAEVWSTSEAYVAGCPECHLEFVPVLEGMKLAIMSLSERRRKRREAGLKQRMSAKAELMQLFK